jgi:hypothetical protein
MTKDQVRKAFIFTLVGAWTIVSGGFALAAQGTNCLPTTGTVPGLSLVQLINSAFDALTSSFSGASAPTTTCTGLPVKGQIWLDTSGSPNAVKRYDGANWLVEGYIDPTNHVWLPPVGGGTATIASASTTDLWSVPQSTVTVSGTTTIAALANASAVPGTMKIVKFSSVLTLTYNAASLMIQGGTDFTTSAGDAALVIALTSTNVSVIPWKADGTAVVNPAVPVCGQINYFGGDPPAKFALGFGQALTRTSYPDYLNCATVVRSATRVSGSATLTGLSDTLRLGPTQRLEGAGIPAGATIASTGANSIVMASTCGGGSSPCLASSSGTSNVTTFLHGYGIGGDTSTIGVPNCSGRVTLARDTMSGSAVGNVTVAGSGIHAEQVGAMGGTQGGTIPKGQLPIDTLSVAGTFSGSGSVSVTSNVGDILRNPGGIQSGADGTAGGIGTGAPGGSSITSTGSASVSGSIAGTTGALGSGDFRPHMNPVIVADCIIRILP